MVFRCFWICEGDGGSAVVGAIEMGEVFGVGAEDEGEDFGPACHGGFKADDVGEFVDGEGLRDGAGDGGEGAGERVETVGDGDVLHYIGLVEDIGAGRGNVDLDEIGRGGRGDRVVGHASEECADFGRGKGKAAAGIYVGD